jgi:peptidoglycan/LPS O-acetylase OafA/YrhL
MVVVFHHFAIQVPPFNEGALNQWIGNGNFMVNLFFVLSGFVLYHRYQAHSFESPKEIKTFYLKRAKRLLPLYFLGLIAGLGYYLYMVESIDWIRVVLAFSGLQSFDVWSYPVINVPSWSLSVEFFLYLMFPFVLMFLQGKRKQFVLIFSVVIWLVSEVVFNLLQTIFVDLHLDFIPFFSLGSFIVGMASYQYLIFLKNKSHLWHVGLACIMILTTIFVLYQPYLYKNYSGLLAPLFGILILSLAGLSANESKGGWMDKLGDISYPIYILHWPIYFIYGLVLEYFNIPSRHTFPIFGSYILLVIFFSALTNFIQRVMMKKTTRLLPL